MAEFPRGSFSIGCTELSTAVSRVLSSEGTVNSLQMPEVYFRRQAAVGVAEVFRQSQQPVEKQIGEKGQSLLKGQSTVRWGGGLAMEGECT